MMRRNVSLSLGKPAQFALVGIGALLVLLVGWLALLGPKQKQIADLHSQATLVQQQIAEDLARAATARGASSTPTINVADFYKLQTAMPSAADMPDLLLELDQTAKAAGVAIRSISPSPAGSSVASVGASYSPLNVSLSVSGNFYALTDLLYRLRNLVSVRNGALEPYGRIFAVNSISMTPGTKEITAQIQLTTYVYTGASSAASTSASTGTTTTTTAAPSSSGPSAAGANP
jgi:Tfp pilus assembly protein PilO